MSSYQQSPVNISDNSENHDELLGIRSENIRLRVEEVMREKKIKSRHIVEESLLPYNTVYDNLKISSKQRGVNPHVLWAIAKIAGQEALWYILTGERLNVDFKNGQRLEEPLDQYLVKDKSKQLIEKLDEVLKAIKPKTK